MRKERVTASKPFERGYRFFSAGKVQSLSIHGVTSASVYCIIRATVLPSQKPGAHKTAIALNKTNGQVLYASCTCVAGNSACNHTAAMMFAVNDVNREQASRGNSGPPSSTSLPRKWGVPAKSKKEPTPVMMLEVAKPKYGKESRAQPTPTDAQPIDPALGLVDMARVMSLWEDLEKNNLQQSNTSIAMSGVAVKT